jgi:hypothetical protein
LFKKENADEVGFEPTLAARPKLISSQPHSTTLPLVPLRTRRMAVYPIGRAAPTNDLAGRLAEKLALKFTEKSALDLGRGGGRSGDGALRSEVADDQRQHGRDAGGDLVRGETDLARDFLDAVLPEQLHDVVPGER